MNPEQLLAHYDRIADAPDAVARLRCFVLDLAVRGKLVEQDSGDEPASELLERIRKARTPASAKGSTRDVSLPPAARDLAMAAALPTGWAVSPLGDIIDLLSGQHLLPSEYSSNAHAGIPYITGPSDFSSKGLQISRFALVRKAVAVRGQLLLTVKGSGVGKAVTCDLPEVAISRQLMALSPVGWNADYLRLVLHLLSESLQKSARSLIPGIAREDVCQFILALPPLAEQHRIVAKVDELMALCDQLEAARAAREATRDRLAAASLARLNSPDPETFQSDARFALDTLPSLTARPDQIKQLRQTIVNLAVRGQLTRQSADDTLSKVLFGSASASPVELPGNWRYLQLSALLAEDTRNGYSRRPDDAPEGTPILRISAGTARQDGIVSEEEHKLISGIDAGARVQYGLRPGDLVACRFNGNKGFVGRLTMFTDYLGLSPIYPDKLIRVRVSPDLATPSYIRIAGDSDLVRREVEASCATTVGNWGISASSLKQIRFPVPPLAEQHRIVAKLDELMALCDRLEATLTTASDARRRALEALLVGALAPADSVFA